MPIAAKSAVPPVTQPRVQNICAGLALAAGVAGLIGWVTGDLTPARLSHAFIPMAPATGLALIALVAAVATVQSASAGSMRRKYGGGIAAAIAAVGVLRLVELAFGHQVSGFETLFVENPAPFQQVPTGRMSPLTALNFVLDGVALTLISWAPATPRLRNLAGGLATSAVGISVCVLTGYLYQTPLLYGGDIIPMALTTALGFLGLDISVVLANGERFFPLRLAAGGSVKARLFRSLAPLATFPILINGFLYQVIPQSVPVNGALLSALTMITFTAIATTIAIRVAQGIGSSLDAAEARREDTHRMLSKQHVDLVVASRITILGDVAARLTHEINNPLSLLQAQIAKLKSSAEQRETTDFATLAREMEATTSRIHEVTACLSSFSWHEDGAPPKPVSLRKIIDDTLIICRKKLESEGVQVEDRIRRGTVRVACRPTEIAQVLLNLVTNACDALDGRKDKRLRFTSHEGPGTITIYVCDNGSGFSRDVTSRLAEPYFTTKPTGTGLGLSICQEIVHDHGGHMRWERKEDETYFAITLPSLARDGAPQNREERFTQPVWEGENSGHPRPRSSHPPRL